MKNNGLVKLISKTFQEWNRHKAPRLGAALAYYTIFSISPLLIILIAVVGLAFDQQQVQNQILGQIQSLLGKQGADLVQGMIASTFKPGATIVATIIGVGTLVLGAIGVFGQLQDSLNTIWEVLPNKKRGILGMIQDRILSFGLVLGTGFLLLVSLALSTALQVISQYFGRFLPIPAGALELLNFLVSFAVITLLFATIYKFLPDAEIHWRDVWVGGAFTALLFTIGKFLLGLYLGRGTVGSTYGAAGALVVLLVWIYYSAQILFFGAEFTRVYASMYGSQVIPEPEPEGVMRISQELDNLRHKSGQGDTPQSASLPEPESPKAGSGSRALALVKAPEPGSRLPATRGALALAKRKLKSASYQRNVAALFAFLAGTIVGARILGHAGRQNGHHNGRG